MKAALWAESFVGDPRDRHGRDPPSSSSSSSLTASTEVRGRRSRGSRFHQGRSERRRGQSADGRPRRRPLEGGERGDDDWNTNQIKRRGKMRPEGRFGKGISDRGAESGDGHTFHDEDHIDDNHGYYIIYYI